MAASPPLFLFSLTALSVCAALVVLAGDADAASLVSSERFLLGVPEDDGGQDDGGQGEAEGVDPPRVRVERVKRQQRYDYDDGNNDNNDNAAGWSAGNRRQQAGNGYQNTANRNRNAWDAGQSQDEDAIYRTSSSSSRNSGSQQGNGRYGNRQRQVDQGSQGQGGQGQGGYRPYGTSSTVSPNMDQDYYGNPVRRTSWNSNGGADNNGFLSGGNGGDGFYGGGMGGVGMGGVGGMSGGGGLFGNRPSIIGSLIRGIGQGFANTVQGVSAAMANKWNTKAAAARGLASSLIGTGRQAARSGLQAGMAHPRFAVEAIENVF